jgi:N-acyl-D-amino-acid deacylase
MAYDLVIKNGSIIDGSGNPWFKADIGVSQGRISKMGKIQGEGDRIIDARGLMVSPGFIDLHTHNELTLMINPEADKLKMGVTTEIVGTCGVSAAPVRKDRYEELRMAFCTVGGGYGFFLDHPRVDWEWSTFGEFMEKLEDLDLSVNVGSYVGHLNLRIATSGLFSERASKEEITEMEGLVEEAMENGAYGLSTALSYVNADTEEIIKLCSVVSKYGGHYAQHDRDRSIDSTREGIEISEKSGAPLQLSHHTKFNAVEDLAVIRDARDRGVDILMDHWFVPYGGAGGPLNRLPAWAREGGMDEVLGRLEDPQVREEIKEELGETIHDESRWRNTVLRGIRAEGYKEYLNKDYMEIARIQGKEPFDALFDMYIESDGVMEIDSSPTFRDRQPPELPEWKVLYLTDPLMMIASDSMLESDTPFMPDPRAYGVYPGVIEYYVREEEYITLEDAIRKMTSLPAQRLGLMDRGVLREGMWADLVIFDREGIKSRSIPGPPETANRPAEGIKYVIVNGEVTMEENQHTGAHAGRVLRP